MLHEIVKYQVHLCFIALREKIQFENSCHFPQIQVKILYVRNLMMSTTEESLREAFGNACGNIGSVERVKKIRDYAFVHFRERDDALRAMEVMNGKSD